MNYSIFKIIIMLKTWLYVIVMSRTHSRVNPHYICLNVKEVFARNERDIWNLSDFNGTRTHNHLVRKRTLNHLVYELSGCGFESRCSHLRLWNTLTSALRWKISHQTLKLTIVNILLPYAKVWLCLVFKCYPCEKNC